MKTKEKVMTTNNKLAAAALLGLMTAGLLSAQPAMATDHEKGACKGKSGCKGASEATSEKSSCNGHDSKDASSCSGKAEGKDKASCSGKDE